MWNVDPDSRPELKLEPPESDLFTGIGPDFGQLGHFCVPGVTSTVGMLLWSWNSRESEPNVLAGAKCLPLLRVLN